LLKLHEFASEFHGGGRISTAAQILLDYTTVKFAVSSNALRRVGPFRRLKERVNKVDGETNDLFSGKTDPLTGFFLMYAGPADKDGKPGEWFLDVWSEEGLIVGLAQYRPPAAAYVLALTRHEPAQHRFYHGQRPTVRGGEPAGGGVEIYYSSPSFLLTAGGMFLNSGYGSDELTSYQQTGAVQATTLLPTGGNLKFEDLIRFDIYPGERLANNTGVHLGFACGANLRIPDRWKECSQQLDNCPWTFINLNIPCGGLGPLGFYVVAYRTSPSLISWGDGVVKAQPDNVGFIHAIEASQMSFDDFKTKTREANFNMPKVDYDGEYVFNAADGHSYTFRVRPFGFSYQARVVSMDGKPLEEDLSTLPLAEGPYLSSPGHEGYFQIRHPGCTAPLVLDFRNTLAPIRIDNAYACPQWLLDLAGAFTTLSEGEWAAGDQAAAIANSEDAFTIYRQLTQNDLETYGPKFVYQLDLRSGHQRVVPALLAGARADAEEAVRICQQLVQINQAQYQPLLAGALATLDLVPPA